MIAWGFYGVGLSCIIRICMPMIRTLFTLAWVCFCTCIEVCGVQYEEGRARHRGVVLASTSLPDARSQPWCVWMTTMRDDGDAMRDVETRARGGVSIVD
jgi:hypothetical protein